MRISILLRLEMKRRCIAAFSNKCKLLCSPLIRLAVRSTPSSVWEKAFIVVRFSRNLASLHNYCHPPRLFSASIHAPVAADSAAGRRACVARPKGKSEGMTGRSLLQTRQRKVFPALRCNQSHIRFNTSSIYVANRFFGTFLTQESTVLPSSPVPFWEPPQALAKQLKHFCAFMQCFIARKLHFIHTLGIIYGEKLWITWTTKWG